MLQAPTLRGLSKLEAAKELGISAGYVDRLLKEGRLPYMQCGSLGRLIDEDAVAAMRRQRIKEGRLQEADKS
jgi:excisionase family DNA binding protein